MYSSSPLQSAAVASARPQAAPAAPRETAAELRLEYAKACLQVGAFWLAIALLNAGVATILFVRSAANHDPIVVLAAVLALLSASIWAVAGFGLRCLHRWAFWLGAVLSGLVAVGTVIDVALGEHSAAIGWLLLTPMFAAMARCRRTARRLDAAGLERPTRSGRVAIRI